MKGEIKMKRFIAAILSVVMILTLLPFTGTAAENTISSITETADGMVLTKSAQLQSDGTYKITLEAFASGQTTTSITTDGIPMDIALVIDQSGSMMDPISLTAADQTNATVQELGAVPGAYVVQGADSGKGYYYYHAAQYVNGAWYYDSDTADGDYTLTALGSSTPIYLSRLGALSTALHDFVDSILADTTAYDSYVDHRIALIGYGFGPNNKQTSYGFVSPGSNSSQSEEGFVNTGLYVNGTMVNYGYYASGIEDYTPETYMPHYVVTSTSLPVVFYCDTCDGWYSKNHINSYYCNGYYTPGTEYTPKTSASGSGTLFYDLVGHTSQNYRDALVSVNDGSNNLTTSISTAISNIGAFGATNVGYGIDMAKSVFKYNPLDTTEARKRIVVVFSDGACEPENIAMAMDNAQILTSDEYNATIYTVGLYSASEETEAVKEFMHSVSSNYPNASYSGTSYTLGNANWIPVYELEASGSYFIQTGSNGSYSDYTPITYSNRAWHDENGNVVTPKSSKDDTAGTQVYISHYMSASNASGLNSIFTSIATTATSTSTSVTMDQHAVLRDVLNPGLFELSEDYQVAISTQAVTTTNDTTYTAGAIKNFTTTDGVSYVNGSETLTLTVDKAANAIDVTGFDYAAKYVSAGHPGEKLVVTITGVKALDAAATGGYVYTNNVDTSGVYDGGYIVAAFPKPQVMIASKSFVLDYAKRISFDAAALGLAEIKHVCMTLAEFDPDNMDASAKNQKLTYGTMTYSGGSSGSFTYAPLTTDWSGFDSFYVFGLNTAGENEWIRVSVLPANNVYYEDDFVTSTDSGTVGIVYSGDWTVEGTPDNNTETPNGDIHGWENSLADDTGYSDGSSHISSAAGACATFTFTGTGVDIYSRTNMQTGIIIAILTRDGEEVANMVLMVDDLAASGDYYQIPTLSIHTIYDSATQQEVEMPYGTYTLQLMVSTAYTMDADGNYILDDAGNPAVRSTYYLDGIRVYNPLQSAEGDSIVSGAYGDELNASFTEVRDLLIDAGSFGEPADSSTASDITTRVPTRAPGGSWTKVEIGDISATDTIAITMTKGDTTWALYNANGTGSAPTAVEVTVSGTTMTSDDVTTLSWNVASNGSDLIIYVAGSTSTWLYSTGSNNGTRVGTNTNKYWTIDANSGYLKHSATGRYLGVYTDTPDWRAYTNTTGNTAGQTLSFWKLGTACSHNYVPSVTSPTCVDDGYTTYTCSKCENSYISDTVPATGEHSYVSGACSVCGAVETVTLTATRVTDATTLNAGDQIILVANGYNFAMGPGNSNGNNRTQIAITKSGSIVNYTSDVQIITLEAGSVANTFAFNVGNGYLYAASSSSNHLKTKADLDDNGSWKITIDANGIASIIAQGTNTRNIIRYNSSASMFAAYASGQQDVSIYMVSDSSAHTHSYTAQVTTEATCNTAGVKTFTCSCNDSYTEEIPATGNHIYVDGACSVCGTAAPDTLTATLVTDVTTLQPGEQIVIVAKDYDFAMGAQSNNGNNRITAQVTLNADRTVVTFSGDTQIITLADGFNTGTFAFDVGELGYLYAASSSSNYLKSTVTLTANASWAISIDASTGVATIVAQGTNTRNIIRYNTTADLFACYGTGNSQLDVCIYRIKDLKPGESGGEGGGEGGDTDDIPVTGFVFIDQIEDKTTGKNVNVIGTYVDYGPKNEVYLAPGQSIAFRVNNNSGYNYYVGLKAPELDDPATTDVDESRVSVRYTGGTDKTISHSTDLYYKLTPNSDGYVIIMNVSGGMLSVTKLRTTGPSAGGPMLLSTSESEVIRQVTRFARPYGGGSEPVEPEVTPDVQPPYQKPNEYAWLDALVENLFKSLLEWFRA